jgi:competence protein ComEC
MWKNKPAVAAAVFICAGIWLASQLTLPWYDWVVAALFLFLCSSVLLHRLRHRAAREATTNPVVLLCLMFSAAAAFSVNDQIRDPSDIRRFLDGAEPANILCEVISDPAIDSNRVTVVVRVLHIIGNGESHHVEGDASLTILAHRGEKAKLRIAYGTILRFDAILESPTAERNPGEFSYRDYLALNHIYAVVRVRGYQSVECVEQRVPSWIFARAVFPAKHFIRRVIDRTLKGDQANFLTGLLLGDRTNISPEIKNAFVNTGVVHVLAVSGSHVVLVVAILYALCGLLRVPRKLTIVVTILGILFYMLLTGSAPSIVRACLMAIVVLLAKLFQERTNVYNALGVSAVIILVYDPQQLFDVGCQLSFGAVFSMAYFFPKLKLLIKKIPERWEEIKGIDAVLQLFAVSLAAQIGTIPFTAHYFGRVSIVSLLANLVVVPLAGLNITIGFASVFVSILSGWAGSAINEVNALIIWFVLKFVMLANAVPHASILTPVFGLRETMFYGAAIAFLFSLGSIERARKTLIVAAGIAVCCFCEDAIFSSPESGRLLRVTFIDVGQGDAALIECPAGERILVDAGEKTVSHDVGEKIVVPFLRRRGIGHLDAVVVSHPDADHLGGVPYVLRNIEVGRVIDAGQAAASELYRDYAGIIRTKRHFIVRRGERPLDIKNARLYILHPSENFVDSDSSDGFEGANNSSVVIKLLYGKSSFLFVGDAEVPVEKDLVQQYSDFLQCDILKVGHHGSRTSSSEEFLTAVKPHIAVVSVGRFNKFRHPSKLVIQRLKDHATEVHRTDEEGAIQFESDGISLRRIQWREQNRH